MNVQIVSCHGVVNIQTGRKESALLNVLPVGDVISTMSDFQELQVFNVNLNDMNPNIKLSLYYSQKIKKNGGIVEGQIINLFL